MTKCNVLMTRSRWSLTVREACPVDCQTTLKYRLSDGKQARVAAKDIGDKVADMGVKVECLDDKVQVVIDGTQGVQSVAKTFQRLFL